MLGSRRIPQHGERQPRELAAQGSEPQASLLGIEAVRPRFPSPAVQADETSLSRPMSLLRALYKARTPCPADLGCLVSSLTVWMA
jgi:hypothetical protein